MGTQFRDERSLFDSTNDELGVGSTSICRLSMIQGRNTWDFSRLVGETDDKALFEPEGRRRGVE